MVPDDVSFEFLREITDNFSCKVGRGAFGDVYKGVTKDGHDVAVKLLKTRLDDLDNKQFRNELDTLKKLEHQNIVKFLGYCYETKQELVYWEDGSKVFGEKTDTALCFEYLHNGSLQDHLPDEPCEVELDWHTRFKIIKGICEGLKYMHKDLEKPICHFDLKPGNILLNKDMIPKIADFGLSRIFGQDTIRKTRGAYGTLGYQPPEYIDEGKISEKFDIFSLGAVIKRIVSRPMGSDSTSSDEVRQVKTCTQIALNCLDEDSQKRPDIVEIIERLNGIEVSDGKLPDKRCGIDFSKITVQGQNTDLLSSPSCEPELTDAQETLTDVVDEHIVGREEEKGKIISLLESSSEKMSILPIHGIGGIGKTTFSRLIYKDPKFKYYSKAWVHVSQRFDLNKIRQSIIPHLSEQGNQASERHVVHSSHTKLLPVKKTMIVLDDLWETDQFQLMDLKHMLRHLNDSEKIILVTTRSESVAKGIYANLLPYKISPLTDDMCWDIIKQRSGIGASEEEKLRGIGLEIAQKCLGVALAAQSLGFTLRGMNFDQWMKVRDNDIWKEHNHVLASLMLSYNYMDPSLQPCFTYCAIFPKGHQILKNDLIYQWISLGFIKPTELLSVMDLSKKYIMQLQGLSFLQESPKTFEAYSEKDTIFTMHDLVHDLAISLLGNKLLDKSKQENSMGKSKDYRYALLGDCSMPQSLTCAAQLIALRFLDCRSTQLHGAAFAPATSLKVLDLSECYIKMLPDSISELKELRYLNAPRTRDQQFPECITKLSHLIFLNLHGSGIKNIPESIGEMKDLMHLDLSDCEIAWQSPNSFRDPANYAFLQLSKSVLSSTSELFLSLSKLRHLRSKKCWFSEKLVHLDFSKCSLDLGDSEFFSSLSRLEHLSLSKCLIDGDLAKALCGLTELRYLDLSQVVGSGHNCGGLREVFVKFTKLRYLDVRRLLGYSVFVVGAETENFRAETENFIEAISTLSSLEYLNLSCTKYLYNVPDSFGNLSKLRTLDVSDCFNLERLPAAILGMDNMKFVNVDGCDSLDKSTLALYKNVAMLPYFVVRAGDSEYSSNLCQLEYEDPTKLEIGGLENVKSAAEAQRIKLVKKQRIKELGLVWTRDANRFFVEDKDVLEQLVPPRTVKQLILQGYNSTSFPSWMMNIATFRTTFPHLVDVTLEDMPNCSSLPPLGQLPNLKYLSLGRMDSIRKIGQDLFGGAFPRLRRFKLQEMKCLEEWNTSCSYPRPDGGVLNLKKRDVFRRRAYLDLQDTSSYPIMVADCPMLRFKSLSPLALGKNMIIIRSGQFIPSSWKCRAEFDAITSSVAITVLCIEHCEAPLQEWSLLRHLPCLKSLIIKNCSDLTCSSTDLLCCLPFLVDLSVSCCERITALPESIQQLTCLQRLEIYGCQQLLQLRCPTSIKVLFVKNCDSIAALPERLGDLTCLENLEIIRCRGIKALPESIQQLTCLRRLEIYGCPELIRWCESKKNKKKLAHIETIVLERTQVPERIHPCCLLLQALKGLFLDCTPLKAFFGR